jgi:hypothetical protein
MQITLFGIQRTRLPAAIAGLYLFLDRALDARLWCHGEQLLAALSVCFEVSGSPHGSPSRALGGETSSFDLLVAWRYSITSSARARRDSGMVSPSALAVPRRSRQK